MKTPTPVRRTILCVLSTLLLFGSVLSATAQESRIYGTQRITGPYVWRNLNIYLVHGVEAQPGRKFLTLQEAMQRGIVVVHETGSVNELAVENLSATEEVYIQGGEIVKGGRQDRTVQSDLVLAPKSGRVPLAAFCVESGRWRQRGSESDGAFSSSNHALATKELKLAAKRDKNQGRVWAGVKAAQEKLNRNLDTTVNAAASATSLQLSLENRAVETRVEECMTQLGGLIDRHPDAIGFAFAIDGTMNSADIYGTTTLFRALWPKLLRAAAVEALAEGRNDTAAARLSSIDSVVSTFRTADSATESAETIGGRTRAVTRDGKSAIMFETREEGKGEWLHRSYIGGPMPEPAREEESDGVQRNMPNRIPNRRIPDRTPNRREIPQRQEPQSQRVIEPQLNPRATPPIVAPR